MIDYQTGLKNFFIRMYFYTQRGLALFNEFRYVVMAIFGVYYAMKLTNPLYLGAMFIVAVPFLIVSGWVAVHHVGKVVDYLNIQYSTHWGRYNFTLLEEIRDQLKEINEKPTISQKPDHIVLP